MSKTGWGGGGEVDGQQQRRCATASAATATRGPGSGSGEPRRTVLDDVDMGSCNHYGRGAGGATQELDLSPGGGAAAHTRTREASAQRGRGETSAWSDGGGVGRGRRSMRVMLSNRLCRRAEARLRDQNCRRKLSQSAMTMLRLGMKQTECGRSKRPVRRPDLSSPKVVSRTKWHACSAARFHAVHTAAMCRNVSSW